MATRGQVFYCPCALHRFYTLAIVTHIRNISLGLGLTKLFLLLYESHKKILPNPSSNALLCRLLILHLKRTVILRSNRQLANFLGISMLLSN